MNARLIFVLVPLAAALLACGREPLELQPIATVGGVDIPAGRLLERVESLREERPEAPREHLLHEELSRLVSEQVMLNRAAEIGVEVEDSDVEARLSRLHGEDYDGGTGPDYREQVRRQMTIDRTALLDAFDVIEVKMCATWMRLNNLTDSDIPPFIETVPFGPAEIERLEQDIEDWEAELDAMNSPGPDFCEGGGTSSL